ncbi:hypothetical protein LINPERPRIM_LOCUS27720 [Linum perenne]
MGNCLFNGLPPPPAAETTDDNDAIQVVAPVGSVTGHDRGIATPMRMWRRPNSEARVPRYGGSGVWKVKLVISAAELAAILTEDSRTEELIESVRTVAKCGGMNGGGYRNGVALGKKNSITSSSRSGVVLEGKNIPSSQSGVVLDGKNSAESKKDVVLNEVNSNSGRNDDVLVEKNNTSGGTKTKSFPQVNRLMWN